MFCYQESECLCYIKCVHVTVLSEDDHQSATCKSEWEYNFFDELALNWDLGANEQNLSP